MGNMKSTDFAVYVEDINKQEDGFKANITLDFQGVNPSDGNYISFNGTQFTFRNTPQVDSEVQIGADISATLDNLLVKTNLPTDVTYTKVDTDKLFIEYNTIGSIGNSWTIGCDFVSLPTNLTGGSDVPDPDWEKVSDTTINYKPKEINVLPGSTNTAFGTTIPVEEGDDIILINPDNSFKEFKVDSEPILDDGTQALDILGDGSCIAAYPLDGNANDLSTLHNGTWKTTDANGNVVDGTGAYVTGKFGQAGSFNSNNWIDTNIVLSGDFTISFWVKPIDTTNGLWIVTNNDAGNALQSVEVFANGDLRLDTVSDAGSNNFHADNLDASTFNHIVIGRKNAIGFAYVNNVLIADNVTNYIDNSDFTINTIGREDNYDVYIDQLRVFNKALTADEVVKLYNEQKLVLDITNAGLTDAPVKAFFNNKPLLGISLEPTQDDIIPVVTEEACEIDLTNSLNTSLVLVGRLYTGETLLIDGVEFKINDASYDNNNDKTTIDITSLSLTDVPQSVIRKGYIPLTKVSSTITEFIGTNKLDISLNTGDKIITDQGEAEITTVNKEFADTTQALDILGDNSCIACYPLDGNANDLSGNYNGAWKTTDSNGNVVDATPAYDTGKFGQAGSFNGSKLIDTGITATNVSNKLSISVFLLFDENGISRNKTIIDILEDTNVAFKLNINDSSNLYLWIIDTNSNYQQSTADKNMYPNKWYHIVLMFDLDNNKSFLYIDGVKYIDFNSSINISNANTIKLGGRSTYSNYYFVGLMDQVRIFNKALTADEINKLYYEQLNKYTIDYNTLSVAPNFVAVPQRTNFTPIIGTMFDGEKFTSTYGALLKEGRAIQRRIVLPEKDIEVIPPFQSQMWKKN